MSCALLQLARSRGEIAERGRAVMCARSERKLLRVKVRAAAFFCNLQPAAPRTLLDGKTERIHAMAQLVVRGVRLGGRAPLGREDVGTRAQDLVALLDQLDARLARKVALHQLCGGQHLRAARRVGRA